ncbi:MAG: hypothetical protein RL321_1681 [Pseudomonadota bacterium]
MDIAMRQRGGVLRELADDFFEDVLERHETQHFTILVDDESQATPIALKILQLRRERRAFGHVVRLALHGNLAEAFSVERAASEFLCDALHVQQAHHVAHIASIHGQSRMRCLTQLVEDALPIVLEIDARDILARNHDVVDGDAFEIEDADQHLLVAAWNHQARFGYNRPQLLAREGVLLSLSIHVETNQAQRPVGDPVHGIDGGSQ